ncbi:MAG: DEAD/DEAH box helicase [Gammaproteobacteria bacterium]|nr:DEAD/DEAH box helicase [Gammaproteobacteria bacterium]
MSQTPASLVTAYQKTTASTRKIFQILSVVYQPTNLTTFKKLLSALPKYVHLVVQIDSTWRDQLAKKGLIQIEKNNFRCHPDIVEIATRDLITSGDFNVTSKTARIVIPAAKQGAWNHDIDPEVQTRALRIEAYGEEFEMLQKRLGVIDYECLHKKQLTYLVQVYTRPFSSEFFDKLPDNLRFLILSRLLTDFNESLKGNLDSWALVKTYFVDRPSNQPEVACFLAEQWVLRNEPDKALASLGNIESTESLTLRGWLSCLQGDNEAALQHYQAALKAKRKLTGKRNFHLPGISGVCFIVALLRTRISTDVTLAKKQIDIGLKSDDTDQVKHILRMFKEYVLIIEGEIKHKDTIYLDADSLMIAPWRDLFRGLMLTWLSIKLEPVLIKSLSRYQAHAVKAGLLLYANESAEILLQVGKKKESPYQANSAYHSLTQLIKAEEPWERSLNALRGILDTEKKFKKKEQNEEHANLRMTWRLFVHVDGCSLEPREQKRTKQGGWTKGRPVSLERLHEGVNKYSYLTSLDLRICRQIKCETSYDSYSSYPTTYYSLDGFQVLLDAAEHPHLVWAEQPDVSVELVEVKPVLEVTRRGKNIRLQLTPFPAEHANIHLKKDGTQRLCLTRFNEQQLTIAKLLTISGLTVPDRAKKEALESVAAIAPLLTIHSDFDAELSAQTKASSGKRVKAHATPVFQLSPMGEGLMVDCFVRPFGDKGPLFQPGVGGTTVVTDIDGKSLQTTRIKKDEKTAVEAVLQQCPLLDPSIGWHWELNEIESALDTLLHLQQLEKNVIIEWPKGEKIRIARSGTEQMKLAVGKQSDWFSLEGQLQVDRERVVSMVQLFELLQGAGRFIQLGKGEFLALTAELRKKIEALSAVSQNGRFHPLAAPLVQEVTEGMNVKAAKQWREQLAKLSEAQAFEPTLPDTLQAELRDYQEEGYRWLARIAHWGAGACLADDMGLGKTIQALAILLTRAHLGPALILAPTSVCMNWIAEATRFAPTLKVHRFGTGNRQKMLDQAGPFDLIVCSYGLLQVESKRLAEVTWTTVVADEAQAIKNSASKRAKAAMGLQADFRIAMTGTPIENHLGELWSLFRFINPGLLSSLEQFNQRFAAPIEQHNDRAARQRLKQLIRPFILRRLKTDVLTELPARTEITIHVEQSPEEAALYEALRQKALETIQDESLPPEQRRFQVLAEVTRLRQACCHPRLVMADTDIGSAKLKAFGNILDDLRQNHHKALVFSQFVKHLALIRAYLDAEGIHYQYLDGSTPIAKRAAAVEAFQRGDGDLFLISLKAGGSGLNLTAADYVVHMDPWWNPAVEDQASDRAHRIGQQRPVTIYRLVTQNTIEEKIVRLHTHKRDLADSLLEDSDMSGRMSVEDMVNLLKEEL